jgi:hypothetical protein
MNKNNRWRMNEGVNENANRHRIKRSEKLVRITLLFLKTVFKNNPILIYL